MLSGIFIQGGSGGGYFFTVLGMSDEESAETPVVVAPQASEVVPLNQTMMNCPPSPQLKPPPPLNLVDCSTKKWKSWKQAWLKFSTFSKILTQDVSYQKALFLCTIGQSALEIYNAFRYNTSDNPDKVDNIIVKFDEYFMGDVNKIYERFKFNQRNQEVGKSFDTYLTGLGNLAESCNFCTCRNMSHSLLRDRIVLGIRNEDARKRLLQNPNPNLDLRKCIDICRTSESATTELQAIGGKLEQVHTVNNAYSSMKTRGKRGGRAEDLNNQMPRKLKCKFCCKSRVLKKELCPALGKRCNLCRKMKHWKSS